MRRSGIKRGRRRPKEWLQISTCREVLERQEGFCICGCGRQVAPYPLGYHHVFPKARWPELVNEADNIVGVAGDCHANHEAGSTRLPRRACDRAERLACSPPMEDYLTRTYGPKEAR